MDKIMIYPSLKVDENKRFNIKSIRIEFHDECREIPIEEFRLSERPNNKLLRFEMQLEITPLLISDINYLFYNRSKDVKLWIVTDNKLFGGNGIETHIYISELYFIIFEWNSKINIFEDLTC